MGLNVRLGLINVYFTKSTGKGACLTTQSLISVRTGLFGTFLTIFFIFFTKRVDFRVKPRVDRSEKTNKFFQIRRFRDS